MTDCRRVAGRKTAGQWFFLAKKPRGTMRTYDRDTENDRKGGHKTKPSGVAIECEFLQENSSTGGHEIWILN